MRGISPRASSSASLWLPKSEQQQEIDSDFYHGGCVYHDDASVDPMKLLLGLLDRARRAGAAVLDGCAAQAAAPHARADSKC